MQFYLKYLIGKPQLFHQWQRPKSQFLSLKETSWLIRVEQSNFWSTLKEYFYMSGPLSSPYGYRVSGIFESSSSFAHIFYVYEMYPNTCLDTSFGTSLSHRKVKTWANLKLYFYVEIWLNWSLIVIFHKFIPCRKSPPEKSLLDMHMAQRYIFVVDTITLHMLYSKTPIYRICIPC